MTVVGPFDVEAEQIERLGAGFTAFINELLIRESVAAEMLGHEVRVDSQDESADGGVDASLINARQTPWLPEGRSAWQFKRSDLQPAACKDELHNAVWARKLLTRGASYRLALGKRLGDQKITRRRDALVEEARASSLTADESKLQVLDANALARWASQYPSLAISRLLGGRGHFFLDFDLWSSSNRHQTIWTSSDVQQTLIDQLLTDVGDRTKPDLRVEGNQGVGKTRLVIEAVRQRAWRNLVVYVPDARADVEGVIAQLLTSGRTAIVIVDECEGRRHEKLAELLPTDANVQLISIGESDGYAFRSPVLAAREMTREEIHSFLDENHPQISNEARRFVSEHSNGNVRFADVLAQRTRSAEATQAAELIRRNDIQQFLASFVPEGNDFFVTSLLALFDRVGWERDKAGQLEILADFAEVPVESFRSAARILNRFGLLAKQGRYRAVTPHPFAVYMAAEAWRQLSSAIVRDLLPRLDHEMMLGLLNRASHLGTYPPARDVLQGLLSTQGLFGSLESIEEHELADFMTKLAIIAPETTAAHLHALIQEASLSTLKSQNRSRRQLVWALEKLAWHSRTFEVAADDLLRLSLSENESYGNNATGVWVALFGAVLPSTAATPDLRVTYLKSRSQAEDPMVRKAVADAIDHGLSPGETVAVSAELQGGVLVEPRGGARTLGEAAAYRTELLAILSNLSQDQDDEVSGAATETFQRSVIRLLGDPLIGEVVADAILDLDASGQHAVRKELLRIQATLSAATKLEASPLAEAVTSLIERLPAPSAEEELALLLELPGWDVERAYRDRFQSLVREVLLTGETSALERWIQEKELPSAWSLGQAIWDNRGEGGVGLASMGAERNPGVVAGYLSASVAAGNPGAFDTFFQSRRGKVIPVKSAMQITTRGPASKVAISRALSLTLQMPVAQSAYAMAGWWQRQLSPTDVGRLLDAWLPRMADQVDYSAVVDWMALWMHERASAPRRLGKRLRQLLDLRRHYPDLRNERWDWTQLAMKLDEAGQLRAAVLILDLVSSRDLMLSEHDSEAELMAAVARHSPTALWDDVGRRLQRGDWRVVLNLRGWITNQVPVTAIEAWIGGDIKRAELVAEVAHVGDDEPTPLAQLLLGAYGSDEEIRASLAGEFHSGVWMGPYSGELRRQISILHRWQSDANQPAGLRDWASEMARSLEVQLGPALEDEAESELNG